MSDDIDIEEHDLFENPKIKNIFPDLTILKKEIVDPYDEGHRKQTYKVEAIDTHFDQKQIFSSVAREQSIELNVNSTNVKSEVSSYEDPAPKKQYYDVSNTNFAPSSELFSNKIILGSKPAKQKLDVKLGYDVKIILKNIHYYLIKNDHFCCICQILFPKKSLLEYHKSIFHYSINDSSTFDMTTNNESAHVVQPKIQDSQKKCFHCEIIFSTREALIEHLYDVLDRKNVVKSKNVPIVHKGHEIKNDDIRMECGIDENMIYQCTICSYYFKQEKFCENHMVNKHNVKNTNFNKILFNPKCKFCYDIFNDISQYNAHLHKKHKNMVIVKTLCTKQVSKETFNETDKMDYEIVNSSINVKRNLQEYDKTVESIKNPYSSKRANDIKTDLDTSSQAHQLIGLFYKSVLFKCQKCDINFLSLNVATNHIEHNEMLINWKCPVCLNFFKKNDQTLHIKQHLYTDSFTVLNLHATDLNRVLIKCTNCAVHFNERNFFSHFKDCTKKDIQSSYCSNCDILIDRNLIDSHKNIHDDQNWNANDFIIIDESVDIPSTVKDRKDMLRLPVSSGLKLFEKKISVLDNCTSTKLIKKSEIENQDCSDSAESLEFNSDDDNIKENISERSKNDTEEDSGNHDDIDDDSHFEEVIDNYSSDSEESIMFLKVKGKSKQCFKSKTKPFKRKIKDSLNHNSAKKLKLGNSEDCESVRDIYSRLNYKYKVQPKVLLNLTYCDLCECFINKYHKINVHLEGLCINILKRVCTVCGLILTNKAIQSHKAFHKLNPSLTLQDFTFYDLKTMKVIPPPIPKLPKCENCETHCTKTPHVIGHRCSENTFTVCHICNKKFSEIAINLHLPFHNYSLKSQELGERAIEGKKNDIKTLPDMSKQETVVVPIVTKLQSKDVYKEEGKYNDIFCIYVCDSCNISLSTYDSLVEHCYLHYNNTYRSVSTKKCEHCKVAFEESGFAEHEKRLCKDTGNPIQTFIFDLFNFGFSNRNWIKKVFESLSENEIDNILQDSIYRFEHRVKLEIVQKGSVELTLYQCSKCRIFVDGYNTYRHTEDCKSTYKKYPCAICGVPFLSTTSRNEHRKIHDKYPGIGIQSYRIVIFNRIKDKVLNKAIASKKNYYVLYQCRSCHGVVETRLIGNHICNLDQLIKCSYCGLFIQNNTYDRHITRHKTIKTFTDNNMKVILFGQILAQRNDNMCSFNGLVYDYTFYKCIECDVCIRHLRPCSKHFCLINAAKTKCARCDLYFDEGKIKSHYSLHTSDPELTKEVLCIIPFDPQEIYNRLEKDLKNRCKTKLITHNGGNKKTIKSVNVNTDNVVQKTDTIYECVCGLHHLTSDSMNDHIKNKKCKKKYSRQICSKCNLLFTPDVLFKHLLIHHGHKNVKYTFDIVKGQKE